VKDYAVEIKIKNNLLESRMRDLGIKSSSELGRQSGVNHWAISKMLNLKYTLYDAKLLVRNDWVKLSEFFGCEPHNLCPESIYIDPINDNRGHVEIDAEEMEALSSRDISPIDLISNHEGANKLLSILKPRERVIVESSASGVTYKEIGKEHNISGMRVRQIYLRSIERMKSFARLEGMESGLN
jgi:RNA polymerase sigma factor (sigma-70 family)